MIRRLMVIGLLLSTGHAAARDPAQNEEMPVFYDTATAYGRPLSAATASVTVLDREAIRRLGVASVAELLRFVPGVELVSTGPRGGVATAQLRGGDPNFATVMVDGVPLNDATDQFGGAVNLNSLSVEHVERIEFVRGPVSSSLGSGGLAGAINIISRNGADAPRVDLAASAGDASTAHVAASIAGGRRDGRSHFVGVSFEEEGQSVANDRFEQVALTGNLRWQVPGGRRLTLRGRLADWESEDYPEASGGPTLGSGRTRSAEHEELSLGVDWESGPRAPRHRVQFTGYVHNVDRVSPAIGFVVPASTETTRYADLQVGWTHQVRTRGRSSVSVGAELERERGESDGVLDFGGPTPTRYALSRVNGAVFCEVLVERGKTLYELGLRVDVPEEFSPSVSPRLGVSRRLPGNARLRASLGRAYKLPSFFALAFPIGGNPNLDPEVAWSADLGVEKAFEARHLTAGLRVFRSDFEDLVDFDFDTFQNVNRGEVDVTGAELSVDWRPSDAWIVAVDATYQDAENRSTADRLLHRPRWVGSARVGWRISENAAWNADFQVVSGSFDRQIPVPGRERVAGYGLIGTSASYRLTPSWLVRARVDNVTGRDYEPFIGFPGPGREWRAGVVWRHAGDTRRNGPGRSIE